MTSRDFQTIVVGAGGIGSAVAHWLPRLGHKDVLVLDRFGLNHENGGSNDHSRIIRHSYHDNAYGRLTQASYDNWRRLEADSGQEVLVETGGLDIAVQGTRGVDSVLRYRQVLSDNGHPFEALDRESLTERFPQWSIDSPITATFQPESGIVDIRRATQAHQAMAASQGVQFRPHSTVRHVESLDEGVRVSTDTESFTAERVILTTGSWSNELLEGLGISWRLSVTQEQVSYFQPKSLAEFAVGEFPLWVWHTDYMYYGFPIYGEVAVKVSRDMSGRFVTPETRSFDPVPEETKRYLSFLEEHLPSAAGRELYSKTCVYDMPPDRNFVIDSVPGHPNVVLGFGAGHAAKFAGLLGEILAEIAVTGHSTHPIDGFEADRAALMDPSYEPALMLNT